MACLNTLVAPEALRQALELELVDGIRTTQAAQVKLQQERCSRHGVDGVRLLCADGWKAIRSVDT